MPTVHTLARRLPWPLPALLCWAAAWALHLLLQAPLGGAGAALIGTLFGGLCALAQASPWRRLLLAAGFPASLLLLGAAHGAQATWWLLPMALLACLYPVHAWRDAPWYPTGRQALRGLAMVAPLTDASSTLDAGCGLGHGLAALRAEYPTAQHTGTEWSVLLAALTRLRCPWARVHRGDLWADDWSRHDLVYLFQRPESMPRAVAKARAEMRPGSWLVSLAFEAPGLAPTTVLRADSARPVWIYRIGEPTAALKSPPKRADMQNNILGAGRRRRSRRSA